MSQSLIRAVAAAAILVACAVWVGCSREPRLAPADQVYTVRGRIETLPVKDQPASELTILHEPIPTFVNKDGHVVGMDSMAMPFSPAPGVSLDGLAVGDQVEFTFEVRWKSRPFSRMTSIGRLPGGVELHFGKSNGSGQ